jgi:HSP20 family molecular chaperone IbpA
VEEKRVSLNGREYQLDVPLPAEVDIEQSAAQFDCITKYLHLSLTCK